MKTTLKIIITFAVSILLVIPAFAVTKMEAKNFFNKYIQKINSYASDVPALYSKNVNIKRILIKDDGSKEIHEIDRDKYISKLKFYSPFAKLLNYRNEFSELNFKKEGANIRVTGYRQPSTSDKGEKFPVSFLIGEDKNGHLKIIEDITTTKNARVL